MTYIECLLAVIITAQTLWVVLRHFTKFRRYKKLFDAEHVRFIEASVRFSEAQKQGNEAAMKQWHLVCLQVYETQRHIMRAQAAVMSDNFIAPWRWPERWNADYLKETA